MIGTAERGAETSPDALTVSSRAVSRILMDLTSPASDGLRKHSADIRQHLDRTELLDEAASARIRGAIGSRVPMSAKRIRRIRQPSSDQDVDIILNCLRDGMSLRRIGRKMDCDARSISRALEQRGIDWRDFASRARGQISDAELSKVAEGLRSNKSLHRAASAIDRTANGVRLAFQKRGTDWREVARDGQYPKMRQEKAALSEILHSTDEQSLTYLQQRLNQSFERIETYIRVKDARGEVGAYGRRVVTLDISIGNATRSAGRLSHTLQEDSHGNLIVHELETSINERLRDVFAAGIEKLEERYRILGVSEIIAHAAYDDVWHYARRGFNWSSDPTAAAHNRDEILEQIKYVCETPNLTAADRMRLKDDYMTSFSGPLDAWPSLRQLTERDTDTTDIGRRILRGLEVQCVKTLCGHE